MCQVLPAAAVFAYISKLRVAIVTAKNWHFCFLQISKMKCPIVRYKKRAQKYTNTAYITFSIISIRYLRYTCHSHMDQKQRSASRCFQLLSSLVFHHILSTLLLLLTILGQVQHNNWINIPKIRNLPQYMNHVLHDT